MSHPPFSNSLYMRVERYRKLQSVRCYVIESPARHVSARDAPMRASLSRFPCSLSYCVSHFFLFHSYRTNSVREGGSWTSMRSTDRYRGVRRTGWYGALRMFLGNDERGILERSEWSVVTVMNERIVDVSRTIAVIRTIFPAHTLVRILGT